MARNLASRQTDLAGFFRGLEAFSAAVAPVAQTQADLYVNLDTTFRALAPVAVPFLQDWITQTPPTFNAVINDSPSEQAFLRDTAGLFSELRPGFATLESERPRARRRVRRRGAQPTRYHRARRAPAEPLSSACSATGRRQAVNGGLDRLTQTLQSLRSPLAFLTPAQSTCNYVSLFLRNIGSTLQRAVW